MATGPQDLLARQNADGGWCYRQGGSWTEPTCYALLALAASGFTESPAAVKGAAWLQRCQRTDGGLAPTASVPESTWITALPLLLPSPLAKALNPERLIAWVLEQSGRESGWIFRLRLLLLGDSAADTPAYDGWPWYPGAAAWITPTAMSILAMEKIAANKEVALAQDAQKRVNEARRFLLARHCRDGGWNHGSTRALGYDSDSYPETTGTALLALHGYKSKEVDRGLVRAEDQLAACQSYEAAQWLRLGLLAHGRKPRAPFIKNHGSTMEIALGMLADAAESGRNLLVAS